MNNWRYMKPMPLWKMRRLRIGSHEDMLTVVSILRSAVHGPLSEYLTISVTLVAAISPKQ
jgi:hypothetical protein